MKKIDVKDGQQFNQLTVIRECKHRRKDGQRRFWCVCECGKHRYVALQNLVGGRTKSCGCLTPWLTKSNRSPEDKAHLARLHESMKGRWDATFVERFWKKVQKDTGYFSPVCDKSFGEWLRLDDLVSHLESPAEPLHCGLTRMARVQYPL